MNVPTPPAAPPAPIDIQVLLQGRDVISIEHRGEIYRLRVTKQGKLILTK